MQRPPYADLPEGRAQGVFGADDAFGCLNLLTPERVAAATELVQAGRVFSLNANIGEWPNPSPFGSPRSAPVHHAFELIPDAFDDYLDSFYLQGSTQWDGFLHIADAGTGSFYGGAHGSHPGVAAWAERGLAGRSVLLDLPRWAAQAGRNWDWRAPISVSAQDLVDCADWERVRIREGTILLVRVGWEEGYRRLSAAEREEFAAAPSVNPGLEPVVDVASLLWNWGIAAIACDNPALEVRPATVQLSESLHTLLLSRLGMPIGEFFLLDKLALACAESGCYEQFFTAAPINLSKGVGSPANALALI